MTNDTAMDRNGACAEPSVIVEGMTTGYRGRHGVTEVTRGLDASLYPCGLTCLLGPNGAGKSTLLRTLAGFRPPLAGSVKVLGREIGDYAPSELARAVSVVLTEKPVLENMDVSALVGMGRVPYTGFWGHLSEEDRRAVNDSMELVGIGELRSRSVQTLSDGERQKVMIAKALAQQTQVIFLDEPTAFLDYPSKVEIMMLLRRLAHEERKTIFLSTHDLELALRMCDRVWLIDKHLGVETGTPGGLSESGAVARYFERPGIRYDAGERLFRYDPV